MSTIKGIFFKDPVEQTPEERQLAHRFVFALLGTAALIIFAGFLVAIFTGELQKTSPAAEIKEFDSFVKGGFIGVAGFVLLAMAFGKRHIYQILMLIAALASAGVVFYLGWKYANPMMQVMGGVGFAAWSVGQVVVTVRGIKRILSGDDVLLKSEGGKSTLS